MQENKTSISPHVYLSQFITSYAIKQKQKNKENFFLFLPSLPPQTLFVNPMTQQTENQNLSPQPTVSLQMCMIAEDLHCI